MNERDPGGKVRQGWRGNKQINQSKQTHNKSETKEQQQKASEKETQRWGAGLCPVPGDPRHHPTMGALKQQPLHPHPLHGASPPKWVVILLGCPHGDPAQLSPSLGAAAVHTRGALGQDGLAVALIWQKKARIFPEAAPLLYPEPKHGPARGHQFLAGANGGSKMTAPKSACSH